MKMLSIIIPCYNEAQSLSNLFDTCRLACENRFDVEFVFVDNGSTDNSASVFEKLLSKKENNFARLITVPVNKGYGYGIIQGLFQAEGIVLAWTHADLQTDPTDVILSFDKYMDKLLKNNCIVKGERKKRNWVDALFTMGMSLFASILLSSRFSDINAQPKMFNRELLSKFDAAPTDFSLDLFLLYVARTNKIQINTYPVLFNKRNFGESKGGGTSKGKLKLTNRTVKYILKLSRNIIKKEK